jgi:hypothetical protein
VKVEADAAVDDAGGVRFEVVAATRCGCSWPAARWRTWRPRSEAVAETSAPGVEAVGATAVAAATEATTEGTMKSSTSAT